MSKSNDLRKELDKSQEDVFSLKRPKDFLFIFSVLFLPLITGSFVDLWSSIPNDRNQILNVGV